MSIKGSEGIGLKKPVSPYYFFLAKRLIQRFYFGIKKSSDLQLVKKIYDRYKSENKHHTEFIDSPTKKIKRANAIVIEKVDFDPFAKGMAKRIHKILKTKDLYFTPYILDYLAKEIRNSYDQSANQIEFETWDEFVNYFKVDRGAIETTNLCRNRDYLDLSVEEQNMIDKAVEFRVLNYESRYKILGNSSSAFGSSFGEKKMIVASNDFYAIRSAETIEIIDVIKCCHPESRRLWEPKCEQYLDWCNVNPNFIFIYTDEFGIGGYLTLVPVTDEWASELLDKKESTIRILKSDIVPHNELSQIKNILLESIEARSNRTKSLLMFYIPVILERLMDANFNEFNVFYISDDIHDEKIKRLGFSDFEILTEKNLRETKTLYVANGRSLLSPLNS